MLCSVWNRIINNVAGVFIWDREIEDGHKVYSEQLVNLIINNKPYINFYSY